MSTIPSPKGRSTSPENGGIEAAAARPTSRFRRLSVPRKLIISYLSFVFPLAVLLAIVDVRFVLDTRAVERELGGVDYAERVLAAHAALTRFMVADVLGDMASSELETRARAELGTTLDQLETHHVEHCDDLGLTQADLEERGLGSVAAPVLVSELRTALTGTGFDHENQKMLAERLLLLSDTALDLTGVTQDSSLDSNALVRAALVHLPDVQRITGDAIVALSGYGMGSVDRSMQAMTLQTYGVVLLDTIDRHIGNLVSVMIREDDLYFDAHPEVQGRMERELAELRAAANSFVTALTAEPVDGASAARATALGVALFDTSAAFLEAGVSGTRALINDRPPTYLRWRIYAIGGSIIVILLVTALVFTISRSISTSVRGIIGYTRRVASGDRAASLNIQLPDDLHELYGHTRGMVDDITTLTEFPRRNPNGVMSVDERGEIIYRNPSVQDFLDRHGITLEQFLPGSHAKIVKRLLTDSGSSQKTETRGHEYVLEWSYYPVHEQGHVHVYVNDITDRKRAEEQLIHDSFHDSLTGLPNRALFTDRLKQTLSIVSTRPTYAYAVFLIDLDRFKMINETLGHDAGDKLLRVVASRIIDAARPQDTVARLGGDEFAVLLPDLAGTRSALQVADRIHAAIREPLAIDGETFNISCSIGIVIPERDRNDPLAILRDADSAMYSAKSAGKARSEVFNRGMYETAISAMRLENELVRAAANGEIIPFFQPIVSLETGKLAGFEALARWLHPERGMVSPGEFIPIAEETGLIIPIGNAILERSVRQASRWHNDKTSETDLFVSVNLSVRQFAHEALIEDVRRIVGESKIDPACLKLEITESGLMENVETSMEILTRFKQLQITLGIDDFGTGYSSLSYLHRFPFDTLKVDQSFVGNMETERESAEIVTNVLSLAHGLGKEAVAEGIETPGQLTALRSLSAEYGQGYYFAKPLTADGATDLIKSRPRW